MEALGALMDRVPLYGIGDDDHELLDVWEPDFSDAEVSSCHFNAF